MAPQIGKAYLLRSDVGVETPDRIGRGTIQLKAGDRAEVLEFVASDGEPTADAASAVNVIVRIADSHIGDRHWACPVSEFEQHFEEA